MEKKICVFDHGRRLMDGRAKSGTGFCFFIIIIFILFDYARTAVRDRKVTGTERQDDESRTKVIPRLLFCAVR